MRNLCFFFLITVLLISGCKQQNTAIEEPDPESIRSEIKPTEVHTAQAQYRAFEFRINSSGILTSENELKVTFESSGVLEKLLARNGKRVKKGELLAELENDREGLALEKAQIALENARISFENDSVAHGQQLTPIVRKNLKLKSGLDAARVSLKEAMLNLENTRVTAPISGILSEIEEKEGNVVTAGGELALIYEPHNLVLTGKILETDFKHIGLGLQADVYPLSFPEKAFSATLIEFNPRVDENGMITLKLKLNETDGLLPGMNANAVIRVPQSENVIVPREALVMKSGRAVVFTLENGFARWNYVELGLDNGVDLEITKGVEAGSTVIISNNLQLAHDAPVTAVEGDANLGGSN